MLRRTDGRRARELTAHAASLLESDRSAAERYYLEAVKLDPELKGAWFDLGLICKWTRQWERAFEYNLQAAELEGEKRDEPAWWNLGIAATALRRWDVARRAWSAYGIEIPDGAGPIEGTFGHGPVRLNPETGGEVVWGDRIDPARMRLANIPFPSSGHRWADIVLHDGAPSGHRESGGHEFPVFDELMRWEPSEVPTIEISVTAESLADIDDLVASIEGTGFAVEDWTRSVRMLCKRCSEGLVHEHTEAGLASGQEHWLGIAAPVHAVERSLERWSESPRREVHVVNVNE
jgi:hypothetical protein